MLQLVLLLELLREAGRQADRGAGEQRLDECARLHAERERIKRFAAHAIDEGDAFPRAKKMGGNAGVASPALTTPPQESSSVLLGFFSRM